MAQKLLLPLVKQRIHGFGLEGFESFKLFQKGFASPSPKNFGLEYGFGFESGESGGIIYIYKHIHQLNLAPLTQMARLSQRGKCGAKAWKGEWQVELTGSLAHCSPTPQPHPWQYTVFHIVYSAMNFLPIY